MTGPIRTCAAALASLAVLTLAATPVEARTHHHHAAAAGAVHAGKHAHSGRHAHAGKAAEGKGRHHHGVAAKGKTKGHHGRRGRHAKVASYEPQRRRAALCETVTVRHHEVEHCRG
jgi:hypothetical protein